MADELDSNPKFSSLSPDAQQLVRQKLNSLSPDAQQIVRRRLSGNQSSGPSLLDQAAQVSKDYILNPLSKAMAPLQVYKQTPQYASSPQGMLEQIPALASQAANKLGQFATEQMSNNPNQPVNPYVAAGVGTAISMAPDIAMAGINPMAGDAQQVPDAAVDPARRALGFSKAQLKTDLARQTANTAAKVALENKVIPSLGNGETMLDRATALEKQSIDSMNDVFSRAYNWKESPQFSKNPQSSPSASAPTMDAYNTADPRLTSQQNQLPFKGMANSTNTDIGQPINQATQGAAQAIPASGTTFEQNMKVVDPKDMIRSIQGLRPKFRGGLYDADHAVIDTAIDTIKAHGPEPLTLEEANQIKSKLQNAIPYNSPGHDLAKAAAAKVRETVDSSLDDLADSIGDKQLSQQFQQAKRAYGSAQRMKDGINNKISSEAGNNILTPTSMVLGAGELAAGNPVKALAAAGLWTALKRSGNAIEANQINNLANAGKTVPAFGPTGLSVALQNLARRRQYSQ